MVEFYVYLYPVLFALPECDLIQIHIWLAAVTFVGPCMQKLRFKTLH